MPCRIRSVSSHAKRSARNVKHATQIRWGMAPMIPEAAITYITMNWSVMVGYLAFIVAWLSALLTTIYVVRAWIQYKKDVYYAQQHQIDWQERYRIAKKLHQQQLDARELKKVGPFRMGWDWADPSDTMDMCDDRWQ
jgi:hypothetical protein